MTPESPAYASRTPRWTTILLWAVALATPLGWSSVAFVYFGMLAVGRPLTVPQALLAGLQDWYVWALLAPGVFLLGRRFRIERHGWVRAALVHLAAGSAVALLDLAMVTVINQYFGPTVSYVGAFGEVYPRIVLRYFHFAFIIYWVIVAAAHAIEYYGSSRDRELEAVKLQAELTEAQLAALRMQLQPHFLFNTLHTIASLVRDGRTRPRPTPSRDWASCSGARWATASGMRWHCVTSSASWRPIWRSSRPASPTVSPSGSISTR